MRMAQVKAVDPVEKKKLTGEMKALDQQLAAWDEAGQRQVLALVTMRDREVPCFYGCIEQN
ncbi:hypothetical protein MHFGQ_25990 [Moorella humiferrea]|uniref:Uncharacterized protein n=2 Tax=Neomoorella humiferrea TaxID=676965 RepID=A0A2T0AKU6_9FIRM|nr:hypothetical protein MOHU_23290 [Moorella humiferrea]